ncbi:MAG: AfsR/SARP family transcriptional regulator [Nonomuraea sp.]|nr:AfsR/SARP family transcriptional regulator [Nonomuraea sp.]
MRISILGPLEVEDDGGSVVVGGLRLRALLAMLALEAGRTVTSERLIDALWPDEPPVNAANALQTLVRRLRTALRPYEVIESRPGGYVLALPPEQVDALAFRKLVGEDAERALALWRGAALADLTSVPHLANVATSLEQERLAAVEVRAERWLSAGRPVDLTAEVVAYPLRERLVALAVRGLAASGRQAEALELFERTRRKLADDLGVDPGPELRAAHLAVLSGHTDPPSAAHTEPRPAGWEPRPAGRTEPRPVGPAESGAAVRAEAREGERHPAGEAEARGAEARTGGPRYAGGGEARGGEPRRAGGGEARGAEVRRAEAHWGETRVAEAGGGEGRAGGRHKGNVREPRTSFIGRESELGQLTGLLGRARLVTLVGPGGAGKTRLATEAALRLAGEFDGPWMVELAPVSDPADLPGAVLDVLGLRDDRPSYHPPEGMREGVEQVGRDRAPEGMREGVGQVGGYRSSERTREGVGYRSSEGVREGAGYRSSEGVGQVGGYRAVVEARDVVERVAEALGERAALVVLDNCEHLVGAAAVLVERLLDECGGLRVLVTSREPLNVPGERLAPVPPLEPPPVGAGAAEAAAYPSVRLLLDRATAARPSFALDEGNAAAVVALCRRLDGMPLAIELAAARLRTMTPGQLADRIDDRFRLLTGGSRTALPRQQTLRAVVEWSWDLLDEQERVLARRLGVFADGATLEAVETVCGGTADVLGALADKSLVRLSPEGRYSMLETIRAYALERLEEAGETGEYRKRHARHLLDLAERAVPELRTGAQIEWIERLAAERDDFAAALRWTLDERDVEHALRLCAALNWYWWMCGYRQESAAWARQVLDLAGETPPPGLAAAYTACMFAYGVSLFGTIVSDRPAMLELSARMDALVETALREGPVHPLLQISRAVMAAASGQDERAAELLAGYAASDDLWLSSSALMIGGPMRSERDLERAVAGFRELGDRWGLSEALLGLAALRAERGAPTDDLIAETWSLTSEWVSDDESISTLIRLAQLRTRMDDLEGAAGDLAEARARVGEETSAYTLLLLGLAEAGHAGQRGDLEESLAIYRDLGGLVAEATLMPQLTATYLTSYGRVLARAGDVGAALGQHRLALDVLGETSPDRPVLSMVLAGFALAAQAGGDQERAAVLFGAASAVEPADASPETVEGRAEARRALGDERFDRCFAKGAAMPPHELHAMAAGPT